ncbi:UNVERIFIED_CONTAM: hypothetical protein PYX00_000669 [Menopon gallinae]|uniref:Uncharacterized protein n=1 Tax=Menopon gallinae TaxID=328185 RepID=A0AAW2IB92_9NEOP
MYAKCAVLICAVLIRQGIAQTVVDTFDPTRPRPGATLPASVDPYGLSRPLPPNVDPFGFSYRPVVAGATLPAMYDPLGVSRPGGFAYAAEQAMYRPAGLGVPSYPGWSPYSAYAGYGAGYTGYSGYGGYPAFTGVGPDNWYSYRPVTTAIGAPLIPDNTAATLTSTNAIHPPPVQQTLVPAMPVAVPVAAPSIPVAAPSIPVAAPSIPVAAPSLPTYTPVQSAPVQYNSGVPANGFNNLGMGATGFPTSGMGMTAQTTPSTMPVSGMGFPSGTQATPSNLLPPLTQ